MSSKHSSKHHRDSSEKADKSDRSDRSRKSHKHEQTVQLEGDRQPFWAHEELEPTDDPFEDDFGDNIKAPMRTK